MYHQISIKGLIILKKKSTYNYALRLYVGLSRSPGVREGQAKRPGGSKGREGHYDGRDTVYDNLLNSGCLGEIFICDEDLQYLEFEGAETWSLDRIKASIKTLCPGIADKF
jgi:hypothetical protein